MTTQEFSTKFKDQLQQLALFAKRIGFDVETGDVKELTRLWLKDSAELYRADRRDEVLRAVRFCA